METHFEIIKKIDIKEIKEEKIKFIVGKIEKIIEKTPNVHLMSSINYFGKELLKLKK